MTLPEAAGQGRDEHRSKVLWWVALLVVLAPLWLVQRDVWDGVIGTYGLERGDFKGIHDWLVPSNWGLMYLIFRAMGWLSEAMAVPHWIWVKLLLCASVVGISLETRRLCADVLGWGGRDSRAAGLLALAFPCWYLLYGSTFVYLVFVWWVFLGHRWLHGRARWQQVVGFGLLLASFQVNSNFVMVFALEAVRWVCRDRKVPWSWARSALVAFAAIGIYLVLRLATPPHGNYAGYNALIMPFSVEGLVAWVRAVLMFSTWLPLIAAPAVLGWLLTRGQPREAPDRRELIAIVLLFGGALFAYMAVGKGAPLFVVNLPLKWLGAGAHLGRDLGQWIYTTVDGWSTRHTFLLSVPAAIASIGLLRVALGRRQTAAAHGAWWAALVLALVVDLAWTMYGHSAKLARMAQEEAIVQALRATPAPPAGRLDLQLEPRQRWSVWTYEANYWMWLAYGKAAWAVAAYPRPAATTRSGTLDAAIEDRERAIGATQLRDSNLMTDYQPGACTTVWEVRVPDGLDAGAWLWARFGARPIPAAQITKSADRCGPASPQPQG